MRYNLYTIKLGHFKCTIQQLLEYNFLCIHNQNLVLEPIFSFGKPFLHEFVHFIWFFGMTLFIIPCYSVAQLCPTPCNPMNRSTLGFPILQHLLELAQTHVSWVGDAIQPPHRCHTFSSCLQSFPASKSFPVSWLFTSSDQNWSFSISPFSDYSGLISFISFILTISNLCFLFTHACL